MSSFFVIIRNLKSYLGRGSAFTQYDEKSINYLLNNESIRDNCDD